MEGLLEQQLEFLNKKHGIMRKIVAQEIGSDAQKLANALRLSVVKQKQFIDAIKIKYANELRDFTYVESPNNAANEEKLLKNLKEQVSFLKEENKRLQEQNDKLIEKLLNN